MNEAPSENASGGSKVAVQYLVSLWYAQVNQRYAAATSLAGTALALLRLFLCYVYLTMSENHAVSSTQVLFVARCRRSTEVCLFVCDTECLCFLGCVDQLRETGLTKTYKSECRLAADPLSRLRSSLSKCGAVRISVCSARKDCPAPTLDTAAREFLSETCHTYNKALVVPHYPLSLLRTLLCGDLQCL